MGYIIEVEDQSLTVASIPITVGVLKGDKGDKGDAAQGDTTRAFFDYFGSSLLMWEDAQRPDIANFSQFTEGYSSKSGHAIQNDGNVLTNSILSISGHRMRWTDGTPGGVPIRISKTVLNREPTRIGGQVCFSTETTTLDTWNTSGLSSTHVGANAPIGCCATSFAQGSVQLALFRHGLLLFVVENPLVDPYYTPWSIAFSTRIPDDDTTPTSFYMDFDRTSSTITVHCPTKMSAPVSITDAKFNTYWGSTFAWQERRSATTDARVSYTAVGAGVLR